MRTLVVTDLAPDKTTGDGAILHRPDLDPARVPADVFRDALDEFRPEVVVSSAGPPERIGAVWGALVPAPLLLWMRIGDRAADHADGIECHCVPPPVTLAAVLALAERRRTAGDRGPDALAASWRRLRHGSPYRDVPRPGARRTVLVVGAGVVNLVTAWLLARRGYAVTVADRSPDPRADRHWSRYGGTRGGASARMFTLTEADDYHALVADPATDVLARPPSECGWNALAGPPGPRERRWLDEFRSTPEWLASAYNEDTFALTARSGELWDGWMAAAPDLFADVVLRRDVLRLYEDPGHLGRAVDRQRAAGALRETVPEPAVRERFPALAGARDGAFAGGLLVRGFTVAVHDLMARILDDLARYGATFRFDTEVHGPLRDEAGAVTGVGTGTGEVLRAGHYVVSTGAYGAGPLRSTGSAGTIQSVVGCWLTVPNVEPALRNSLKVARQGHVTEDANVTVGRGTLVVGSGYGYVGADPANADPAQLRVMHRAVGDTVAGLFPAAWEAAGGDRLLDGGVRYCSRPWTASNLGVFERVPAAGGGSYVITGGHNTGGFAQAPVIAEAVLDAVTGRLHPMHLLHRPDRMRRTLADRSRPGATAR